jgi:hypothetical protein
MSVLRNVVVFLLGVGAAAGAYMSGAVQRIPDYFPSWNTGGETPVATAPAPATVETPAAGTPVATAPGYPGYSNAPPGYDGTLPGYNNAPAPGYASGAPVEAPKGAGELPVSVYAANGVALKLNIIPDPNVVRGRGVCVVYALVNRTNQPIFVSLDTARFTRRGPVGLDDNQAGLIVQPGETKVQAFAGFDRRFREGGYRDRRFEREDRFSHGDPLYRGGPVRYDNYGDERFGDRYGPRGPQYADEYRPDLVPCATIEVTN